MPKALKPKDVVDAAKDAGLDIRYGKGTRVVITDNREDSPTKGAMLSIGGHTTGEYDRGVSRSIRKWFLKVGVTLLIVALLIYYFI